MGDISYLPGKKSAIYQHIVEHAKLLANGVVLVIDPSIGSLSSMPGYAVYERGLQLAAGTLTIDPSHSVPARLKEVYRQLRNLSKLHRPDICVYEEIPVSAHGGRSQVGHASLLKAVGVTLAAVDARAFIGLLPVVWKNKVREDYVKGDKEDAIAMGYIIVEAAREYLALKEEK